MGEQQKDEKKGSNKISSGSDGGPSAWSARKHPFDGTQIDVLVEGNSATQNDGTAASRQAYPCGEGRDDANTTDSNSAPSPLETPQWSMPPPPPPPPRAPPGADASFSALAALDPHTSSACGVSQAAEEEAAIKDYVAMVAEGVESEEEEQESAKNVSQCETQWCAMGYEVCKACTPRVRSHALWKELQITMNESLHTKVLHLVIKLNNLPNSCFPIELAQTRYEGQKLKALAQYKPEQRKGCTWESDAGNKAGSALMLALLKPNVFGSKYIASLKVFGYPPPGTLTTITFTKGKSGKGPDNRRMNVFEALLNAWETTLDTSGAVRIALMDTLNMFGAAIKKIDPNNEFLAFELARPCLFNLIPHKMRDCSDPMV